MVGCVCGVKADGVTTDCRVPGRAGFDERYDGDVPALSAAALDSTAWTADDVTPDDCNTLLRSVSASSSSCTTCQMPDTTHDHQDEDTQLRQVCREVESCAGTTIYSHPHQSL